MKALIKISYRDGSNYKFNNEIEVDADLIDSKQLKTGQELEVTELGITLGEWMNPKYREGFPWTEDDHTFVTIQGIEVNKEVLTIK